MIIAISYSEPRFLLVTTEKRDKLQQLTCLPLRKFPMASSVARICLNVLLWLISSRASLRSISGSATSWSKYEKEGKTCKGKWETWTPKMAGREWKGREKSVCSKPTLPPPLSMGKPISYPEPMFLLVRALVFRPC